MAINSKLKSLIPTSERLKRKIKLISSGYSLRPELADGELTVYPWDSEISDWVINASQDNKASFTVDVVQKLTRLPSSMMDRFVASELLLVMLVARSLTADGVLEYKAKCPFCKTVQGLTRLQVPGELGTLGAKPGDYPGYDEITLPTSGDVIKLVPLLVGTLRQVTTSRPVGISENGATLAASIYEVNGGRPEKLAEVFEYYLALPPADVDFLRKQSRTLSPALDTAVPHTCDAPECRQAFHYNLGLHYDFFL